MNIIEKYFYPLIAMVVCGIIMGKWTTMVVRYRIIITIHKLLGVIKYL